MLTYKIYKSCIKISNYTPQQLSWLFFFQDLSSILQNLIHHTPVSALITAD